MSSANDTNQKGMYSRIFAVWDRVTGWIDSIARVFMGAALLGILAMLLLQVSIRFILPFPLPWAEEVAVYLSAYVAMVGTGVCLRANYHLQVDILRDLLGKRARLIHSILINLIVAAFSLYLIKYGYEFAIFGAGQTSPSSYLMVTHARMAMPVGGAILFVQALTMAGRSLDALLQNQNDDDFSGGSQLRDA